MKSDDRVNLVIVEDEKDEAENIQREFADSKQYRYKSRIVNSPTDYIKFSKNSDIDACVVDLNFDAQQQGDFLYLGHLIIETIRFDHPDALVVVYSGHVGNPRDPESLRNIVWSIRQGAHDVVPKGRVEELVERVEFLLRERENEEARDHEFRKWLDKVSRSDLRKRFTGPYLACVGNQVLAEGKSRFEALQKYRVERRERPDLPITPTILVLKGGHD